MKRIPILVGGLLLLIALLICGCGELEIGVETRLSSGRPDPVTVVVTATQAIADNMVIVTVTPTGEGVNPTQTQIPATETATVTPTPSPTETATPSATPTPRATSRPVVPTATPALPRIVSFTAVPDSVRPGDTISANWTAEGQSALLCLRFATGHTDNCYEVAVSGSRNLPVRTDFREDIVLDLTVTNSAGQEALASISVAMTCPADYWFFDNPPSDCPSTDPVNTYAAAQHFEHGWMLWLEETDNIYVFYEPEKTVSIFYSGFGDPDDPAAENSGYDPPDGYYVPKRGFGLVWGTFSYVRSALGWALEPEFGFDTVYQVDYQSPRPGFNDRIYVREPDGRLVVFDTYYLTWSYR